VRTSEFTGTLYIHVGPHKTGSTTIQRAIDTHRAALAKEGLLYPLSGRGPEAPEQHWDFGEAVLHDKSDALDRFIGEIDAEIAAAQATRVLISTEVLSRKYVTAADLARIPKRFPNAQRVWIALLRRQDGLASSLYAEHLKKGLIAYPQDEAQVYGPEFLDHWERLRMIAQASQDDEIVVGSFEVMKRDLVANFLAMMGCHTDIAAPAEKEERQNVALPAKALGALRLINALPRRVSWRMREALIDLAKSRPGLFGTSRLEARVPSELLAQYERGNRTIETVFFGGRSVGLSIPGAPNDARDMANVDDAAKARVTGWMPPEAA